MRNRKKRSYEELRLEEYDFYPFVVTEAGPIEFDPVKFKVAVDYLLAHDNPRAAGELIVIGEQNLVRDTFGSRELAQYKDLFETYDGARLIRDNTAYLENYKRIVHLMGQSFPNTGIEILLHDLVNPANSIVAIENGIVTGRVIGQGTTKLVLDLKTRGHQGQDKLNYELNIGSRQFKCTTIPIFRPDFGLVGAICINIDSRFLREEVMTSQAKLVAFFDNFLKTDMELDENILSRDENRKALGGKRHFLDEAIRAPAVAAKESRHLAAILFSDIVNFTATMEADERQALAVVGVNSRIHREALARFGGRMLKELGDGVLASFNSVLDAVSCAAAIQAAVAAHGGYQVRIGMHLGELVASGGDVFGDGVNIASRIQGEAEPGTIVVSEAVFNNVRNKPGITVRDLGERRLKNVSDPVRLYALESV